MQDPATAFLGGGRFVLLGGVTPQVTSTAAITVANAHGPVASASLPGAQHDAQAAALGGSVYVFGGAEFTQYDHILRFDPSSRSVSPAGTLPTTQSDVAVTRVDGTAYVVGGYDGSNALDTIVGWTPGGQAHVVAHLPVALRYAAVTAVAGFGAGHRRLDAHRRQLRRLSLPAGHRERSGRSDDCHGRSPTAGPP